MPPPLLIRDGTPEYALTLARIHSDARAAAMPWLAVVHSDQETERWMADVVLARQRVRMAVLGDIVVGFSAFAEGWLEQLYVRPGYQGQGVGSVLFRDVCASASGSFQFWVFQRNVAARRFYERHGSRLIKMTDGMANEEREPDVLYEKAVSRS
jgi:GNAT superfamily N-acetyltransferase